MAARKIGTDYGDLLLALAEAIVKDEDLPHKTKRRLFKRARKLAIGRARK